MWWRKKLFDTRWLLVAFVFAVLLPQIANQVGWIAAEMGRQPWIVYGLLRTSEAFSATVYSTAIIIFIDYVWCNIFTIYWYCLYTYLPKKYFTVPMTKLHHNHQYQPFNCL
jgi:cytochrome d ubiquinol oxidase subunit I